MLEGGKGEVAGRKHLSSMQTPTSPLLRPAPPLRFSASGLKSPSSLIALGFLLSRCRAMNVLGRRELGLAVWRQSVNAVRVYP